MIEAVVKDVWVPATPQAAFRRFTTEIDRWWPRESHSVCGERCVSVSIEGRAGGRVGERDAEGREYEWGIVKSWDPPHLFRMSWHPGRADEEATWVEVAFTEQDQGTLVRLTHGGWEVLGEQGPETRGEYDGGWTRVLALFIESVEGGR